MRGWLRLSSLLIHPSIPTSGLHLCGCLSSCSSCPSKSQFLHYPSPHAAGASSELRQWRFPRTCGRNKLASAVSGAVDINWTERSVGINLKGTEHVVLRGSNGLITVVIKWAKLDEHGFGVQHTRLWLLSSLGWDCRWQFMAGDGIRAGENVPPSNLGSDPLILGKAGLDDWCITLSLDVSEHGMDRVGGMTQYLIDHPCSESGVDKPLCGRQEPRLSCDSLKPPC